MPGAWQLFELRRVMQQAVHQRARMIACAGMHDKSDRLVDDQQLFVFEGNIERYGLRRAVHHLFLAHLQGHNAATRRHVARLRDGTIDRDQARQDPAFQPATRIFRKHPGQRLVQSQAGKGIRYGFTQVD